MKRCVAVYPGSFDPVTNGHLDLIKRGLGIFDRLIVAVVANPRKKPMFSLDERLIMLRESTNNLSNGLEIDAFDGLLVEYMREKKARVVLRGLRAISDFEYEFEMALTNRHLSDDIETIFMTPSEDYIFLRASLVKEIASLNGDVSSFVPANVERQLVNRNDRNNALKSTSLL